MLVIEGSKEKIIHCAWSKKPDDLRFCTVGLKEIKFWNPADATKRLFAKGTVGTKAKLTSFNSVCFDIEGTAYTSGTNGLIYTWDILGQFEKCLKGHNGEVTALIHEQGKLISGGKDNKIVIHSAKGGEYVLEKTIDFETSYPRSIDYMNGKILAGLRNGSIFEINEDTEERRQLLASHHEGEAWGLEIIPEDNHILSIGDDNKVMVFDYEAKKFVKKGTISEKSEPKNKEKAKKVTASTLSVYPPNQQGRAVAYCKGKNHVAISNNMGKISIRDKDNLDSKIKTIKDPEEWCEVMRYSPNERFLAVGSHDNAVYVYDVENGYSLYHKFNKHNSFVTSIDWS